MIDGSTERKQEVLTVTDLLAGCCIMYPIVKVSMAVDV